MFIQLNIKAFVARSRGIVVDMCRRFPGRCKCFSFVDVFSIIYRASSKIVLLAVRAKDAVDGESDSLFWIQLGHIFNVICDAQAFSAGLRELSCLAFCVWQNTGN